MWAHDPRSAQDMSTCHNLCSPVFKCLLFQINKSPNHFLTSTLLPPCDTLKNTIQIQIPGRAKEKSFRITSYQDLGIFGVKIPLNVSTVSLPSPSHTFHGAASELDFTLHSRSSKNEIFLFQKVSRHTLRFFFMLKQQKYYGNSYQFMGFCFVKVYQTLKLWCTTCVIIGNWYISFIPVFLQNIFLYFHFCIFLTLVEQAGWYKAGHISGFKQRNRETICFCIFLNSGGASGLVQGGTYICF